MQSGQRRHQITIQVKSSIADTYGQPSVTWIDDLIDIWVAVWPIRGREYFANQQIQGAVTHRIVMDYDTLSNGDKINPNCRVKFDERYFNIQSVINPEERDITLELMCVEAV